MALEPISELIFSLMEGEGSSLRLGTAGTKPLEKLLIERRDSEELVAVVLRVVQIAELLETRFHAPALATSILDATARVAGPALHRAAGGGKIPRGALARLGVPPAVLQERAAPRDGEVRSGALARFDLEGGGASPRRPRGRKRR